MPFKVLPLLSLFFAITAAYAAHEPYYKRDINPFPFAASRSIETLGAESLTTRELIDELSSRLKARGADIDFDELEARADVKGGSNKKPKKRKTALMRCCDWWPQHRNSAVSPDMKYKLDTCVQVGQKELGVTVPTTWTLAASGSSSQG